MLFIRNVAMPADMVLLSAVVVFAVVLLLVVLSGFLSGCSDIDHLIAHSFCKNLFIFFFSFDKS